MQHITEMKLFSQKKIIVRNLALKQLTGDQAMELWVTETKKKRTEKFGRKIPDIIITVLLVLAVTGMGGCLILNELVQKISLTGFLAGVLWGSFLCFGILLRSEKICCWQ